MIKAIFFAELSDQISFCQKVLIDLPFGCGVSQTGLQEHHPGPLGKVRGGRFWRLCPPPQKAEAPAEGLRPADTRRYLGGEAECNVPVRSTSLPPFLWVNKKP